MSLHLNLSVPLICPQCCKSLIKEGHSLSCTFCELHFETNDDGFFDFLIDKNVGSFDCENDIYAQTQLSDGPRVYREWLEPILVQEPFKRLLNVGCGVGAEIPILRQKGYEAYGIDLPYASKYWKQLGYDPRYFFCCDGSDLPFPTGFFDVVYSFGVIEHIGTKIGHCTLLNNYKEIRKKFAEEVLRVTKRSGRIIINCPNKSFPFDIAHGPTDPAGPKRPLRSYIKRHTTYTIHKTWGDYHLLSYDEVKYLFCEASEDECRIKPLSLRNYFSFAKLDTGPKRILRAIAPTYLNHLPRCLWATWLNPFMCVMIRK